MRKLTTILNQSQLRRFFLHSRRFSGVPNVSPPYPMPLRRRHPIFSGDQFQPCTLRYFSRTTFLSSPTDNQSPQKLNQEEESTAELLSAEILKSLDSEPLPLSQRLDLSFSHIAVTHALVQAVLDSSPDAGRTVLEFLKWTKARPGFQPTDEFYSQFVHYFGRRKDFKAVHEVLVEGHGVAGSKCFEGLVDRLVRAGRPTQVVTLFGRMEDYGFSRNIDSLKFIVSKLCDRGYASYAENMVKSLASQFFPDEYVCNALVKGWCIDGKLDEVRRLVGEMHRGGFEIGTSAYNSILDCVCKLCREKDPFSLKEEAENVLIEMERKGIPRDVETFNVLITNLCKIRKTEDAMKLFHRMGEWGCLPNDSTFLVLIKSLYQAARVGEGDEMIDRMKSSGYEDALDKKAYYEFLKILCGIERIDHAMSVFEMMKEDGCEPGIKTYELLMGKLCAHGRLDKANALFKEAQDLELPVEAKAYEVHPRFAKKKKKDDALKKEKKRETLPEKMARKRRRLKKIRLSFVKKPKRGTRRAF